MEKAIEAETKLRNFFANYKYKRYKKGEIIIRDSDEPEAIYYIVSGFVKNYSITPDGKELTLNIYKPGSYFPIYLALGRMPNYYYFQAMSDVVVFKAPLKDVELLLAEDHEILYELTKRLSIGLNGLLIRMQYLLLNDAYNKVVSTFVFLAKRFGENGKNGEVLIKLPITHYEISNLACLTRETTSVEIKKLQKMGLINKRGDLYVINNIKELTEESWLYYEEKPLPYNF
ncbi:hypothetical protein A2V80_02080 [Candidatus Woesebacteria bacterium RBG_16_39_8b]|uniref:HTH crp-type domain-containing protein n=1 Tax=Candidatus Woesebacteria bacterium RBG_16_39_8b TaxID=1802482 RepID=A0A1F7XA06_9BACT|nr:MAG: hypothetical protein A2V80_02080 [Candidatus Woesebacteria bacterium RBG_16_39_8b]